MLCGREGWSRRERGKGGLVIFIYKGEKALWIPCGKEKKEKSGARRAES
jgi:hypothetical protein